MKVTKEKAAENKEAILSAASKLYRERGIDGVGIGELAKSVGLTHGGFYGQFPGGKEQLASEAVTRTFEPNIKDWEAATSVYELATKYLSVEHLEDWTEGCPIPALAADVARTGGAVSTSFTKGVEHLISALERLVSEDVDSVKRADALRLLATIVGAMLIARAVDKPELSREILISVIQSLAPSKS